MREDFQKSVVFICLDRFQDGVVRRTPVATGFVVGMPIPERPGYGWVYLVTARHMIEEAESDQIFVRANRTTEGYMDLPTSRDDWYLSDDADVAAIALRPTDENAGLGLSYIPFELLIPDDYRFYGNISPLPDEQHFVDDGAPVQLGDQVYFIGLFVQHAGNARNLPIIRYGHISRMPEEPITLPRDRGTGSFQAVAYLAECMSWSGNSGAPVIWAWSGSITLVHQETGMHAAMPAGHTQALLGMVSSHYTHPQRADVTGDVLGDITTALNAGIAAITPAEAIRELLMREDLVADRAERLRHIPPSDQIPTPDCQAEPPG